MKGLMVTYKYFYIKYLLCHFKKYAKHFKFPWESPQGKKTSYVFSFFFVVICLVKFRNLKKGIAKMLQRDPMFELLVLSEHKEKAPG